MSRDFHVTYLIFEREAADLREELMTHDYQFRAQTVDMQVNFMIDRQLDLLEC
jgi:hypothetical protein